MRPLIPNSQILRHELILRLHSLSLLTKLLCTTSSGQTAAFLLFPTLAKQKSKATEVSQGKHRSIASESEVEENQSLRAILIILLDQDTLLSQLRRLANCSCSHVR